MKNDRTAAVTKGDLLSSVECVLNIRGDQQAEREALARRVVEAVNFACQKLAEHRDDINRLWREFKQLKPGETIMGCRTRTEFCETVLHRSLRATEYMLSGGNPVSKRKGHETVSRAVPAFSNIQRKRLLEAATIVGTELIPAFEAGHEIAHHIKELKKIAFDSAELSCIVESGGNRESSPLGGEIFSLAYQLATEVLRSGTPEQMQAIAFKLIGLLEHQMPTIAIKSQGHRSRSQLALGDGTHES